MLIDQCKAQAGGCRTAENAGVGDFVAGCGEAASIRGLGSPGVPAKALHGDTVFGVPSVPMRGNQYN